MCLITMKLHMMYFMLQNESLKLSMSRPSSPGHSSSSPMKRPAAAILAVAILFVSLSAVFLYPRWAIKEESGSFYFCCTSPSTSLEYLVSAFRNDNKVLSRRWYNIRGGLPMIYVKKWYWQVLLFFFVFFCIFVVFFFSFSFPALLMSW